MIRCWLFSKTSWLILLHHQPTVPASLAGPAATEHDFFFTPTTSPPVSTIIPFLDISSLATSILPPTPPTSLVSPLPQLGFMLSTPSTSLSHPPIPFHISPHSSSTFIIDLIDTSTPPSLPIDLPQLSRLPLISILRGATSEVFMAPQPLNFGPPPFIFVFTPVILFSISQASSITPLATLPPFPSLLPTAPSPSSLPNLVSLTFTLRQVSSSLSTSDPTLSTTAPSVFASFPSSTNPSSSVPA